jgi:hypothetical protein
VGLKVLTGIMGVVKGVAGAFGMIGKVGATGAGGLKMMAAGMKAFGNVKVILGMGALTLAAIGLGYAIKLLGEGLGKAAPFIKEFFTGVGTVIQSIGQAISEVISSIVNSIVDLSNVKWSGFDGAGTALLGLGIGMGSLAGGMTLLAGASLLLAPFMPVLDKMGDLGLLGDFTDSHSSKSGGGTESQPTMSMTETNKLLTKIVTVNENLLKQNFELMGKLTAKVGGLEVDG